MTVQYFNHLPREDQEKWLREFAAVYHQQGGREVFLCNKSALGYLPDPIYQTNDVERKAREHRQSEREEWERVNRKQCKKCSGLILQSRHHTWCQACGAIP